MPTQEATGGRTRSAVTTAVAAAAALALSTSAVIALGGVSDSSSSSQSAASVAAAESASGGWWGAAAGSALAAVDGGDDADDTSGELSFHASNEYTRLSGKAAGSDYPWLSGQTLIEPQRLTTFEARVGGAAVATSSQLRYTWAFASTTENKDTFSLSRVGASAEVTFPELGAYTVALTERDSAAADDDATTATSRVVFGELVCKYVRREIRTLLTAERDAFLDAFKRMSELPTARGQRLYGARYRSLDHFARIHLALAADRASDHMHDGLGFLGNHVAITAEFESALQAVDARLSVPYWDFTYDAHVVNTTYGGDYSSFWADSELWRADWFGTADATLHTVTEGRFAYQRVASYDSTDDYSEYGGSSNSSSDPTPHNAYGYLRAPWNVNGSPYVTRGRELCGMSAFEFGGMPSCAAHHKLVSDHYDSWYDWAWDAAYVPHGTVHVVIGGTAGCETGYDSLRVLGVDARDVRALKLASFFTLKSAWRTAAVECPTHCSSDAPTAASYAAAAAAGVSVTHSCQCKCQDVSLLGTNDTVYEHALHSLQLPKLLTYGNYSRADYVAVMQVLCTIGTTPGDQLEAASPADVTFWPIHPTVERLWQWKKLHRPFTYEAWAAPNGTDDKHVVTKLCQFGGCKGHHADDVIPFSVPVKDTTSGRYTAKELTNRELYEAADPRRGALPYVYDNFEWSHCLQQGIDFRAAPRADGAADAVAIDDSAAARATASSAAFALWRGVPFEPPR